MKRTFIVVLALALLVGLAVPALAAKGGAAVWHVPGDFATVQEAIDSSSVAPGDTIMVGPGSHAGALVTKSVTIRGDGQAVIDNGPPHSSGMIQGFRLMTGSDGTTISHLRFEVDLVIMNGAAVDGVTIEHCTFINAVQAISNWCGSRWVIAHNDIIDLRTRSGGGIGIFVGDYAATDGGVNDNVVSHNKISGTLHVDPNDCGGYCGSGIVLYADFRWNRLGAEKITDNRVVQNKVSLVSDTPSVVDVVAFEMTDTRDDPEEVVIFDNAVGFNDFRGTANQIALTPEELADVNTISRNLGDNRGHGLHPSLFGPGGN